MQADIILVEYAVNDASFPSPPFDNESRRSFERLIRKLLSYPNQPAVILVNAYSYVAGGGRYWMNSESQYFDFATYYQLPMLSLKACCYHLMVAGAPGFNVSLTINDHPEMEGQAFYYDNIHPDGETGGRVLAELVIYLVKQTVEEIKRQPPGPEVMAGAQEPLPRPMVPKNFESVTERCLIGVNFVNVVTAHDGFEWINENPDGDRPKFGWISTKVGSTMTMKVDTNSVTGENKFPSNNNMVVELMHLKSYEHMGVASVKCTSGCTCDESKFDGHHEERNSQLNIHKIMVSQSQECVIVVTVLGETSSGDHKVKVAGMVVSEVAGVEGIKNGGALWYVHDISMRAKDGVFEVMNHAL